MMLQKLKPVCSMELPLSRTSQETEELLTVPVATITTHLVKTRPNSAEVLLSTNPQ